MSSAIYIINTICMGTFYNYAGCLKTICLPSKESSKQNMN